MIKSSEPCAHQDFLLVSDGEEVLLILDILDKVGQSHPKPWVLLLTQDEQTLEMEADIKSQKQCVDESVDGC